MEKGKKEVKSIPEGYHSVTPILMVRNASGLIDFMKRAFKAKERYRLTDPNRAIMHAEVTIGNSAIMVADAMDRSPHLGSLYVYFDDVDSIYENAIKEGATSVAPVEDQFYGDRSGCIKDPEGNNWWIATHIEDLSPEEMSEREKKYVNYKH